MDKASLDAMSLAELAAQLQEALSGEDARYVCESIALSADTVFVRKTLLPELEQAHAGRRHAAVLGLHLHWIQCPDAALMILLDLEPMLRSEPDPLVRKDATELVDTILCSETFRQQLARWRISESPPPETASQTAPTLPPATEGPPRDDS